MAEIELDGVTKVYDDSIEAVQDVSLTIADGEFIVLVGPSGSGKSTTLRMIAGLEDITEGELRIDGDVMNDVQPQDRNIAMVFQSFALYPHRNVRENIAFPLQAQNVDSEEIDALVTETMEMLGIDELADRKPAELSGGQQQRVALGRALVRDPAVFLLDEPLANLDAKLRKKMRAEVVRLQQNLGTTTIHVTHNQEEAMTMSDRVAVMHEGKIHQLAPPKEAYLNPVNRFVAGFLGSPSMNFFEGVVVDGTFEAGGGDIAIALPDRLSEVHLDGEVTFGIRPEDVAIAESPGRYSISGTVQVSELLGDSKILHLDVAGSEFLAKTAPDVAVADAESLTLRLDPEKIHLFDGTDDDAERVTVEDATAVRS